MKTDRFPKWHESRGQWLLRVYDGHDCIKTFSSSDFEHGDDVVLKKYSKWVAQGKRQHGEHSVSTLWMQYLKSAALKNSEDSQKNKMSLYKNYIQPTLGARKFETTTLQEWQDAINLQFSRGLKKKTLMNIRAEITGFFKYLRRRDFETPDSSLLEIPSAARKEEKAIIPIDAIQTIMSPEMDEEPSINFFRFLLLTGMRPGEALGLQWSDINGSTLKIKRSINARGKITQGKNANSLRPIVIPQCVQSILDKQKQATKDLHSPWVFGYQGKDQPIERTIYCRWHGWDKGKNRNHLPGLADRLGCPETSLYSFRHTFISLCQAGRVPLSSVQPFVGHQKSMDSFGVYGHTTDELLKQAAQDVDQVFAKYF